MKSYVIPAPKMPTVSVSGGAEDRFPVRRIFCVGRNYAEHTREMGGNPDREPPFFFTKPGDAVVDLPYPGKAIPYPPLTEKLHHEVELVIGVGRGGARLNPDQAINHVWGAAVGVDLTRRDLQEVAKAERRPWDWAKGFDDSAPCAPLVPLADIPSLTQGSIWLSVNGEQRQRADLADLVWSVSELIAHCSHSVRLAPGDLIYTGTPAGVGPLVPGDRVECGIGDWTRLSFSIDPLAAD